MFDRETLDTVKRVLDTYPDRILDVLNSINPNQHASKDWLVEKLNEYPHHFRYKTLDQRIEICILASWYGLLAYKLIDNFTLKKISNIDCIDFDKSAKGVAKNLWKKKDADNLQNGKLTAVEYKRKDIKDLEELDYPIVICTSCEHMDQSTIYNFIEKLEPHTLVVLQSNNYREINEHINCVDNVGQFANQYVGKLRNIKFYEKDFLKYKRFMVIGTKV